MIKFLINYINMKKYGDVIEIGQLMLNYPTMIGIIIAIFTGLFLGVEYSDGAIRNKITIGHKRINIYLSNLIVVTATSLFVSICNCMFGNSTIWNRSNFNTNIDNKNTFNVCCYYNIF